MRVDVRARARSFAHAASFGVAVLLLPDLVQAQACESARPTDPAGSQGLAYGTAEVRSFDSVSGRARVFYAATGVHSPPPAATIEGSTPDAVVVAAQAADDALKKYDELSFEPPLTDAESPCASNGEGAALDIYLVNFASADGQAVLDHCAGVGDSRRCAGFVLVENDFRGAAYRDVAEGLRTVVPHEIFHLVQHVYSAEVEPWWAEGSAQWAAKQVYPELKDLERFLPAYFENTWRPLNVPPGGVVASFLYATAIWPVFLSERYGTSTVRGVFEGLDSGAGSVLKATDLLLLDQGSSLSQAYLEFASYNAATSERAIPGQGYADAESYPPVSSEPFEAGSVVNGVAAGLGAFYYSVRVDAPVTLVLEADPDRVGALVMPLEGPTVRLDAAQPPPVLVQQEAVVVVASLSLSRTDSFFTLRAQAPSSKEQAKSGGCSLSWLPSAGAANAGAVLWVVGLLLRRAAARRRGTSEGCLR